jgi:hypothetical protein
MNTTTGRAFQTIRANLRLYLLLNLSFYGLIVLTMLLAHWLPTLHTTVEGNVQTALHTGAMQSVYEIYHLQSNIPLAIVVTFLANFLVGSVVYLTLPSFVVPFSGLLLLAYRFTLWGLLFGSGKTFHLVTLGTIMLEGQGYILAAFAVSIQGSYLVRFRSLGFATLTQAYQTGFRLTARLYTLVALALLLAASFEAIASITTRGLIFPVSSRKAQEVCDTTRERVTFSGSRLFYDARTMSEADARVVGMLLQEATYFGPRDSALASVSQEGELVNIEVYIDSTCWNNDDVHEQFSRVCTQLKRTYPTHTYQVTAISVTDSTQVRRRVFQ